MSTLFDLSGRTVLVTGGSKGIGQSMTLGMAEAGADIVVLQVSWNLSDDELNIALAYC